MKHVALAALLAVAVACTSDAPTSPTSSPTPPPQAYHGSSSGAVDGSCIVTGAYVNSFVQNRATGGYFSTNDVAVTLKVFWSFVPSTDQGHCPQPYTASWGLQANGANCELSGPKGQAFTYVDCQNPGRSEADAAVIFPDGTQGIGSLGLNVQ